MTPLQLVIDCLPLKYFDSHRQISSGSVDLTILDNSTLWLTVSNAAVRSTAIQTVRCGGFLWLKPFAILLVSCSKAEVVECPCLKPCWSADGSRWLLMVGSKRASIPFAAGQRSEIDRWEVLREQSFPGFGIGMTMDDFQIDGIRQDVTELLKGAVRYLLPLDPRCFRLKMLSFPVRSIGFCCVYLFL